jgi:hypothetical protein
LPQYLRRGPRQLEDLRQPRRPPSQARTAPRVDPSGDERTRDYARAGALEGPPSRGSHSDVPRETDERAGSGEFTPRASWYPSQTASEFSRAPV